MGRPVVRFGFGSGFGFGFGLGLGFGSGFGFGFGYGLGAWVGAWVGRWSAGGCVWRWVSGWSAGRYVGGQAGGWADLHAPAASEDDMPPRRHHPLTLIRPVRLVIVAQGHGAAVGADQGASRISEVGHEEPPRAWRGLGLGLVHG